MPNFFNQLIGSLAAEGALVKVLGALTIIVLGHLGVRLLNYAARSLWIERGQDLTRKEVKQRKEALKYLDYLLDAGLIILALLYLNTGLTSTVTAEFVGFVPEFVSALLIGILGIIAINLIVKVGSEFLSVLGFKSYLREVGLSGSAMNVITVLLKGFLYLLLLQVALTQMGIGNTFINELVNASSWAAAFLVAGLLFYGFKDLFQNFAAGIYLKNSRYVRPGEEVKMEEESGEIGNVSLFSTTVKTDSGYTLMTPNSRIMDSEIRFKRTQTDIDTLEDIKKHFVAQRKSWCGAASVEMVLEIFGHPHDQEEIAGKAGGGEDLSPEELIEAVEELLEDEVKAGFVEAEKIGDIENEFKTWFKDGALIVPRFDKENIFPDSGGGSYVTSVAAEEKEILVVDPDSSRGGVYYIDGNRLIEAMEDEENGGYIVLAPEGTTAYWRLKNDLIYSERNYYDELSKTLENRLRKLMRQGRLLSSATPSSMEKYMDRWRSGDRVTRVWNPEGEEDEEASGNN